MREGNELTGVDGGGDFFGNDERQGEWQYEGLERGHFFEIQNERERERG